MLRGVVLDQPRFEFPGLELLNEVGRGPTGVVYRAQDLRINRLVAVKVLLLGAPAERQIRTAYFVREARILARLMPHPNIPAIHALMEHQGQTCYMREFVEGSTLKDHVKAKAISKSDGLQVFAGIEAALARVHEQGIVHRNLQPDNILVAPDATARLIGFSRAEAVDAVVEGGTPTALLETDMQALRTIRDWMLSAIA